MGLGLAGTAVSLTLLINSQVDADGNYGAFGLDWVGRVGGWEGKFEFECWVGDYDVLSCGVQLWLVGGAVRRVAGSKGVRARQQGGGRRCHLWFVG